MSTDKPTLDQGIGYKPVLEILDKTVINAGADVCYAIAKEGVLPEIYKTLGDNLKRFSEGEDIMIIQDSAAREKAVDSVLQKLEKRNLPLCGVLLDIIRRTYK